MLNSSGLVLALGFFQVHGIHIFQLTLFENIHSVFYDFLLMGFQRWAGLKVFCFFGDNFQVLNQDKWEPSLLTTKMFVFEMNLLCLFCSFSICIKPRSPCQHAEHLRILATCRVGAISYWRQVDGFGELTEKKWKQYLTLKVLVHCKRTSILCYSDICSRCESSWNLYLPILLKCDYVYLLRSKFVLQSWTF